jgi:hypothetical protein
MLDPMLFLTLGTTGSELLNLVTFMGFFFFFFSKDFGLCDKSLIN